RHHATKSRGAVRDDRAGPRAWRTTRRRRYDARYGDPRWTIVLSLHFLTVHARSARVRHREIHRAALGWPQAIPTRGSARGVHRRRRYRVTNRPAGLQEEASCARLTFPSTRR